MKIFQNSEKWKKISVSVGCKILCLKEKCSAWDFPLFKQVLSFHLLEKCIKTSSFWFYGFFTNTFFLNCQMSIRISILFKYFEFCSFIEMSENEANFQNICFTKPAFIYKNILIKELSLDSFSLLLFYFLTYWMDRLVIFALCFAVF